MASGTHDWFFDLFVTNTKVLPIIVEPMKVYKWKLYQWKSETFYYSAPVWVHWKKLNHFFCLNFLFYGEGRLACGLWVPAMGMMWYFVAWPHPSVKSNIALSPIIRCFTDANANIIWRPSLLNLPLNVEALLACGRVAAMGMMWYFVDWRPHPSVKISYFLRNSYQVFYGCDR